MYLAIHWLIAHYPSHDPRSMTPAIRTWAFPGPYLSSYSSLTLAVTSSRDPMTPSALCGSWPGTAGTTQRFVRWRKQFQRMQNFERLFKMKKSASHFSSQMVYLLSHPYAQFLDVKDIYLIMEPFFNTQKGLVGKRSIFQNSFLAKSHLKGHEILTPGHFRPCISPSKPLHRISGHSSAAICDYASHFRGLVTESLDSTTHHRWPRYHVELDESNFASINITEDITSKVLGLSEAWKEANKSLYLQRSLRTGWLIRYWTRSQDM